MKIEIQTTFTGTHRKSRVLRTRFIEADNKLQALDILEKMVYKIAKRLKLNSFKRFNHFERKAVIDGYFFQYNFDIL